MQNPFYYMSDRYLKILLAGIGLGVAVGVVLGLIKWVWGLFV